MTDDDLIPLSALQHAVYCLRQAALIHLERMWAENRFTAEGAVMHVASDRGDKRRLPCGGVDSLFLNHDHSCVRRLGTELTIPLWIRLSLENKESRDREARTMKISAALLSLSLSLGWSVAAEAGQKIRIATEGAYPPFNYVDASGQLAGFDVEIAKAICADLAGDCSYVAVPWNDLIGGLEKGDYDLIVASMAPTPERAERVSFSDSYYRSHASFVGDQAKTPETTPEALAGLRIVVASGTIQAEYAHKFYTQSQIVEGRDVPDALGMLAAGKADITLIDAINGLDWMQSAQGERFTYIGDPVTSDFLQSTSRIAARKGDDELIGQVNEAIKHLRLNGTYERINTAYFPFSIF